MNPQRIVKDQFGLQPDHTPVRKGPSSDVLQSSDSTRTSLRNLKFGKVRRVLAALEKGRSERAISLSEHVSEAEVREIRRAYFEIVRRAVSIVRMEHENARALIAELECDVLEEEVA